LNFSAKTLKALLNREKLLVSGVVANNRMNRERVCLGKNSYRKELSFDPVEFLKGRLKNNEFVSWLDICCGEGRALIEAATLFADQAIGENLTNNLRIIGIDLAGMFQEYSSKLNHLRLLEMSIEAFEPVQEFDLITCVHGLHYLGDKLSVIQKVARSLKPDGVFLGNLELQNLKLAGKDNANRTFLNFLRKQRFSFDHRKHLLSLNDPSNFVLPFTYLGADEKAGPNSTGQPVVDSYYKF
jgi:SAM-dependent methyltransferase